MINIAVNEFEQSRRFYEETLGVEFAEERHGDGPVHLNATFGEWDTPSWFPMALWPDPDRAGTVDIGFFVEDLDSAYERALGAGATDIYGPARDSGDAEDRRGQGSQRKPHRPLSRLSPPSA